jgi:hypothetical protein
MSFLMLKHIVLIETQPLTGNDEGNLKTRDVTSRVSVPRNPITPSLTIDTSLTVAT